MVYVSLREQSQQHVHIEERYHSGARLPEISQSSPVLGVKSSLDLLRAKWSSRDILGDHVHTVSFDQFNGRLGASSREIRKGLTN